MASGSGAVGAGAAVARGAAGGTAGRASNVPVSRSRNFRHVGASSLLGASGFGAAILGASIFGTSVLAPFRTGAGFRGIRGSIVLGVLVSTRAGLVDAAGTTSSRGFAPASFAGASLTVASFTGTWGSSRRRRPRGVSGTRSPLSTTLSSAGSPTPFDAAGETTRGGGAGALGGSTRGGAGIGSSLRGASTLGGSTRRGGSTRGAGSARGSS